MERLQVAIEKARAQRDGKVLEPKSREAALLLTDVLPADAGSGTDEVAAPRPEPTTDPVAREARLAALWQAPKQIDWMALRNKNQQIVTMRPGAAAAPFDMLRTRVAHMANINGWKRIAVVSPHSGCGKTLTVANLAFSLGRQSELRTLVLDFDMRRSTLVKTLHQVCLHTMADVIEGRVAFADHALRHGSNLMFGLNSEPVRNPAELLQSSGTRDRLAEIEAEYEPDLVLFDMPPLRATDDSIGFLSSVDAAIIIVAAGETPMNQIDVAERQVAELTNVMGVVLNKCRMMGGDYGYDDYGS